MSYKLIWSILLITLALSLSAAPVSEMDSRLAAVNFLNGRGVGLTVASGIANLQRNDNFRIFALESTDGATVPGFIAISGDDNLPPVMAYSIHRNFEMVPENKLLQMLRYDIELRSAYYEENPDAA
ncbi:MAG: Spi family protease inhibitor, partial [Candidatus Cloacimonetes bacterium]|nr:Spi family protease inhibitor [Candidatus Cloacimonadota bacterium]